MSTNPTRPRLLFAHAHPDDETLATGVAMAAHVRAGHDVRLLTFTLGEEGEVIPPELADLATDRQDRLGSYRRGELRAAMERLGVRETVLGEDSAARAGSRYRDSGMIGTQSNGRPDSLCAAPTAEAVALVRDHLVALHPDVVVTYDPTGGYGHPDHIRTHQLVCAAVASLDAAERPALYGRFTPLTTADADRRWLAETLVGDDATRVPTASDPHPPSVVDDAVVTHVVVGSADDVAARDRALREHRTQVVVHDGWYTLSNDIPARLVDREGFARLDPETGSPIPGGEFGPRIGLLTAGDER